MQRSVRQGRTKRAPFEQTGAAMQFDTLQDCVEDCCCGLVAEESDADRNDCEEEIFFKEISAEARLKTEGTWYSLFDD